MGSPTGYIAIMYLSDMAWFNPNFILTPSNFLYHTTSTVCHTADVSNHPAELPGMDLTFDPSRFTHSPVKASTKGYSHQIFKGLWLFFVSCQQNFKEYCVFICFDTKWLAMLFKTVMIQNDDHNVSHYAYKTTVHV